ncbi:unnamed protein product [Chrysodeixis includens]|uniref:Uncharacterized protein n=1 Tax=Chrysodeixis includens TaxID=689277 RepID=A0A9N8KUK8_CHRIL|nr:unnamed protein product [Chrysodeixis includens]
MVPVLTACFNNVGVVGPVLRVEGYIRRATSQRATDVLRVVIRLRGERECGTSGRGRREARTGSARCSPRIIHTREARRLYLPDRRALGRASCDCSRRRRRRAPSC